MGQQAILEPLSTGDLIDRAIQIYRQNFSALLAVVAIPGLVTYTGSLLVTVATAKLSAGGSQAFLAILLFGLGYFLALVVGPILNLLAVGGLSRTVADYVMLDIPISFRTTLAMIRGRFGTLLGGQLLGMLIAAGLFSVLGFAFYFLLIIIGVMVAVSRMTGPMMAILLIPLLLAAGVGFALAYCAIYTRLIFIPCSIMIEGQNATSSITRSFQLGKGNTWRLAQIYLFDFAIAIAIFSALGIPLSLYGYFSGALDDPTNLPGWLAIAYSTVDQLSKLLTIPISATAYCLLYFDSRVRQEGYDVELLLSQMPVPVQPPSAQPSPQWGQHLSPGFAGPPHSGPPPGSILGL